MPKVTKDKTAMIKRGNILCSLRKERDINQTVVAEYLGITQQAYVKYEHGDSDPTIDALVKLSDFYDVSIDYLLGLSDVQTTFRHEKLEESLKNAYLSLPRNIRADILEAMVSAVLSYQHVTTLDQSVVQKSNVEAVSDSGQDESTQLITQGQATREATNDTEQITNEAQQAETAIQGESTQQTITQEQPPAERPVTTNEIVQKTVSKPVAAARQGTVPHLDDEEYWAMVDAEFPDTDPDTFKP